MMEIIWRHTDTPKTDEELDYPENSREKFERLKKGSVVLEAERGGELPTGVAALESSSETGLVYKGEFEKG